MKILLVYCNAMLENALPIGISQLSSCLKQAGYEAELFDTTFYRYSEKSDTEKRMEALQFPSCSLNYRNGNMEEDFNAKIIEFQPDVIGLSVVEPTFLLGMRLLRSAEQIIKANRIPVVLGGVHAILAPETINGFELIDYICISEGEEAFIELCGKVEKGEDVSQVRGFWKKSQNSWIKNPRAALTDINNLPIMDFTIFGESYLKKPMMGSIYRTISIETTRGCPYHCSYCGDHSLRRIFKDEGPWYRQKTTKRIEEELGAYVKKYLPEFVYVMSESFLSGPLNRVREFTEMYGRLALPFWFNTRPEDITEEKIKLVKDAGCKRISIGLEHGNEEFRKQYLRRNYSNEKFKKACDIIRGADISFSVNVMIGFPYETREMIFDSIRLLRDIKPDGVSTHIFSPYHGTEMRDNCVKAGMIEPGMIAEDFFQDYCLNNPTISKDEILGLFRTIPLYIEFGEKEYPRIKKAEDLDLRGNTAFGLLRNEYYQLKGWKNLSV